LPNQNQTGRSRTETDASINLGFGGNRIRTETQESSSLNTFVGNRKRTETESTNTTNEDNNAAKLNVSGIQTVDETTHSKSEKVLFPTKYVSSVKDEHLSAHMFAFIPETKLLFSCGHWDNSFRVTSTETYKLVQSVTQHSDVVTCLTIAKDFGHYWLVTGSKDCTLMVWEILNDKENPFGSNPLHILFGHDDAVTCVAVNAEFDLVASGSEDGTIILHNLRDGLYIRSIINDMSLISQQIKQQNYTPLSNSGSAVFVSPRIFSPRFESNTDFDVLNTSGSTTANDGLTTPRGQTNSNAEATNVQHKKKVNWIGISKDLYIVTYSADDQLLCTYSLNGNLIRTKFIVETLLAILISEDGKVLITGGNSCLVVFRWVYICEYI
jgi:WD40 repeat protein